MSPKLQGIALRLASTFFGAVLAAGVHQAAKEVPTGQIIFWRSVVSIIPILIYMSWRSEIPGAFRTARPMLHVTRGLFGCLAMVFFFTSVTYLPISVASAIAFLSPLISLPFAAILLGERMTRRIVGACVVGFLGILALLYPSLSGPEMNLGAIIGIGCGLGFAVTMAFVRVHVRTMTKTEPTGTITFYFALVSTAVGSASYFLGWVPLSGQTLAILCLVGLMAGLAHITATEAAARAPISVLAPFDYTGMVWALSFDLVLFAYRLDLWSLVGVVAITIAGLSMVLSDRRQVRVVMRP